MNTHQNLLSRIATAATLLFLTTTFTPSFAQDGERKNELSIGFGITNDAKINWIKEIDKIISADDLHENTNAMRHSGMFIAYKRHINSRWAVGATAFYKTSDKSRTRGESHEKYSQDYYGLAAEGQYRYLRRGFFSLYGLVGGAVYTCKEDYSESQSDKQSMSEHRTHSPKWAFQLSPVGIELGKNIGGKIELGYGYKGIVSGAFFVKL